MSDATFGRLSRFVYEHCGIRITDAKRTMVDGRIRRRMRHLGIDDINDYCRMLLDNDSAEAENEIVHFTDAITTNKTDFFREISHFEFMCRTILPQFVAERRSTIWLWSAACSTGAEPYTIAMLMEDFRRQMRGADYVILASDISTTVLSKAIVGRYPISMIDPIPEEMRSRYIMVSCNPHQGEFRIRPQLRAKIAFFQMNLMDERYPLKEEMDIIFCRNVLIYFDRQTQARVLKRLCDCLRIGGYLVLGHSESITGLGLPLDTVANTIFRRR